MLTLNKKIFAEFGYGGVAVYCLNLKSNTDKKQMGNEIQRFLKYALVKISYSSSKYFFLATLCWTLTLPKKFFYLLQ